MCAASIFTQDSRALVGSESVVVSTQTDSECETTLPSLMRNELVMSSSPGDHSSSLIAPIHGSCTSILACLLPNRPTISSPSLRPRGNKRVDGSVSLLYKYSRLPADDSIVLLCSSSFRFDSDETHLTRQIHGINLLPHSEFAGISYNSQDQDSLDIIDSSGAGLNILERLHLQLGHMSIQSIKNGVKNNLFKNCSTSYSQIKHLHMRLCYGCKFGSMKAKPMGPITGHEYEPLQYLGTDYKGPFSIPTVHGNTGFYLITDHNSGAVWSYPCKDKGEEVLFETLQNFLTFTVEASGRRTRIIHCDADSVELGDKITKFLNVRGIDRHVSAPYTPNQNGLIERAMQKVLDKARILLLTARAPKKYWD